LPAPAYLVVDFGTGGTKCVLFDGNGKALSVESRPVGFRFSDGGADFDPQEAWVQICGQVKRAVRTAEKLGVRVVAVSSTSMREGNVFYDAGGRELLAVPNIDGRAGREAEAIARRWGGMIYEKSGHWPMASFLVCRLKWMEKRMPEASRKVRKVSMINDWLVYRFSGELACEPTNGCETAAFDLSERDWSQEIVRELKIDEGILPAVKEGGTVVGRVSERAAKGTGLSRSAEVVIGAADTEAALVGCRAMEEGQVVAVAGTTTPVQAVADRVSTDSKRRTWTCCHVVPGRWAVESNAGATGMIFDWWSKITKEDYEKLTAEAAGVPPGAGGVRSLIGAMVFNARKFPKIGGELKGVMAWTPRSAISRAVIEGTCFAVRANLEQLEEVLGRRFGTMTFCGGGALSGLWSQIQADVINRRLARHRGRQATAAGAMALCRVAMGDAKNLTEGVGDRMDVVEPRMSEAKTYAKLYGAWRREAALR
jgi:autoinducer-2 kinase